jgi:hypothetical protein
MTWEELRKKAKDVMKIVFVGKQKNILKNTEWKKE